MGYQDYDNWAMTNLQLEDPNDTYETGFVENFMSALNVTVDEDLSISQNLNKEFELERNGQLEDLVDQGLLSKEERDSFRLGGGRAGEVMDYNSMAAYANKKLDMDIELDDQIEDRLRDKLKDQRDRHQRIRERSNAWGEIGNFTGSFTGYTADPISAAAFVLGPLGAARSAGIVAKVTQGAVVGGAEGIVMESAIQPFVYKWKREIGVDYNVSDALASIAMVGGTSATLGGLGGALSAILSKTPSNRPDVAFPLQQMQEEISKALNKNESPEKFFGDLQNTMVAQEGKRPDGADYLEQADEAIDAKFSAAMEKNPDRQVWFEESIDPATGDVSSRSRTASEVMEEFDTAEKRLNDFKACLNG